MRKLLITLCIFSSIAFANDKFNQEKYEKDIEQFQTFREDALGILEFVSIFNDDDAVRKVLSFSELGDHERRMLVISNLKKASTLAERIGYPNYDGWYWQCQEAVGQAKLLWGFVSLKPSSIVGTSEYANKSLAFKDAYKKCKQQRKNKPSK